MDERGPLIFYVENVNKVIDTLRPGPYSRIKVAAHEARAAENQQEQRR